MKKVLVIGGGISGLTTAYWLHKGGHDVTVLEKESRAGGSIRTVKDNGYLIECGHNSTLDLYQEADDLCESIGLSAEKIYGDEGAKNRYVVRDGRLRSLPMGPLKFLSTDLWTVKGKLRLMWDPFIGGCNVLSVKKTDSRFEVITESTSLASGTGRAPSSGTELNSVPKIPSPSGGGTGRGWVFTA